MSSWDFSVGSKHSFSPWGKISSHGSLLSIICLVAYLRWENFSVRETRTGDRGKGEKAAPTSSRAELEETTTRLCPFLLSMAGSQTTPKMQWLQTTMCLHFSWFPWVDPARLDGAPLWSVLRWASHGSRNCSQLKPSLAWASVRKHAFMRVPGAWALRR